ncbi:MAG: hypothetical protein WC797_01760 [Candidatus Paceibacterota bacterium]
MYNDVVNHKTVMTSGKIIGFDMDGVLVDHSTNRVRLAAELGYNIALEQTPSEIFRTLVPDDIGRGIQIKLYDDRSIALTPPLIVGCEDGLYTIKNSGAKIFLISRRKNPAVAIELLQIRGLWPKFFNEGNTFFVSKPEDKNKKAIELGITYYVDDETRVLEALNSVENRFLFDPFDVFADSTFTRYSKWPDLVRGLI